MVGQASTTALVLFFPQIYMSPSKASVRISPAEGDDPLSSPKGEQALVNEVEAESAKPKAHPKSHPLHKPSLHDFTNVREASDFIGEDASGPAGQLIVTLEEGRRSVAQSSHGCSRPCAHRSSSPPWLRAILQARARSLCLPRGSSRSGGSGVSGSSGARPRRRP